MWGSSVWTNRSGRWGRCQRTPRFTARGWLAPDTLNAPLHWPPELRPIGVAGAGQNKLSWCPPPMSCSPTFPSSFYTLSFPSTLLSTSRVLSVFSFTSIPSLILLNCVVTSNLVPTPTLRLALHLFPPYLKPSPPPSSPLSSSPSSSPSSPAPPTLSAHCMPN